MPNTKTTTITTGCINCEKSITLETTNNLFQAWKAGKIKVQEAFPKMPPEKREVLISGLCSNCWEELFDNESNK